MTNPNNAIGTNAAYNGRTSVNAFNDSLSVYNRGIMSGWSCVPNVGLTVSVGGVSGTRDVAIAEDNLGNKTTINNISAQPINVTLPTAPVSNSRIDLIVIYVDGSPQGVSTVTDNPSACGIVAVKGTASATPSVPNDSAIRAAITADGAAGTTAYYTILAQITIASGDTDITSGMITAGQYSQISTNTIQDSAITTSKIHNGAITADKISFSTFPTKIAAFNAENYSLNTNYQDVSQISNVPAGTYIGLFDCSIHQETGSTYNIIANINTSTDGYIDIGVFNTFSENTAYWTHLCGFNIFTVSSNSTVTLRFKSEASWSMRQSYGRFLIFRIK